MSVENKIHVNVRPSYGRERIYPSCNNAELLTKLIGSKTFDIKHIAILRELGYTIIIDTPVIETLGGPI